VTRAAGWAALALVCFSAPSLGAAQAMGVVYGTISDTTGAPIAHVRVSAAGGPGVAGVSDVVGRYRLGPLASGWVMLRFERLAYRAAVDSVTVPAGDSLQLDVTLHAGRFALVPVVVTAAKRSQLLDQSVTSVALVTDSDLARRALNTVDEAVNKAPGVLFLNGQVNIRGSSGFVEGVGSRVLLLVDGVPANEGDRGGIDWDLVPLDVVERVEVVKGAGSSLYGSAALGGVINVLTRDIPVGLHARARATGGAYANPPTDAWRFRGSTGGLGGLVVTGSYGSDAVRGSLTLGGRHSDGYREQDRSDQWEAAGKTTWVPAPGMRLTASGSWTSHQYQVSPPWCERGRCNDRGLAYQPFLIDTTDRGAYTRSDKGYLATVLERAASARFAWQARGSWLRTHFTSVQPSAAAVANRFGTELRATARPGEGDVRVLTIGVEGARSDVTSDLFGSHAQNEFAAYGEGEVRAGPARLSVGARLDARALDGAGFDGVLSPRAGIVLPTAAGTWRLSAGRGFRAPSMAERFVSTVAFGLQVTPNPWLESETAWAFELGNATPLGSWGRLDAALFWTEARRLIEPTFIKDTLGVPKIQFQNVARARLRGLDLSLVAAPAIPGLTTTLAYTLLDARDLATDAVLAFRPTHLVTLGADYAWRAVTVGGDFRYVSRIERIVLGGSWANDPRVATQVLDVRAGWRRGSLLGRLLVANALNYIYNLTPGTLEPVRTVSVILTWTY
jgi:outer membrane receptor protein involved in Fe transport